MAIPILEKQRRAARVVETALLSAGLYGRSVSVQADGRPGGFAVFLSAARGINAEPFYVTGKTIAEAVRNMIDSIKGRKANAAKSDDPSEVAPF